MAKYEVYKTVTYDLYQEVEADSMEEAIEIAQEMNDWDSPIDTEEDYTAVEMKEITNA